SECLPPTIVSPALAKQPNPNTKQVCRNHQAKRAANCRPDRGFASSGIHLLSRAGTAPLRLLDPAYAEPITISGIVVIPNHFYVPA
ncbi:hypothetical protein, partial [Aporhodopirellula aestuarii]